MRKMLTVAIAGIMMINLIACSNTADQGTASGNKEPAATDKQIVIKISHQNASTHPVQKGFLRFKELVEEKSNGSMTCDIYDSAVLGNDTSNLQQVISGTLDAAMIMGVAIWQGYDSRAGIEEIPFLFSDYESARAAWDGEFGDYVTKELITPQGGHVVGYWENGFRHFTNNIRAIKLPADMAGIKFRTAESEIRISMFETMKASAIVMAFSELYSAMQQGTVDGQENPLSNIVSASFYEVQKYLSLSGHIYNTSVFIFSDTFWNSLTGEQQKIIVDASDEAKIYTRELNSTAEEEYLKTCKESGMEVNEVDKDAFVDAVQPVWNNFSAKYGSDLIKLAQKYNN